MVSRGRRGEADGHRPPESPERERLYAISFAKPFAIASEKISERLIRSFFFEIWWRKFASKFWGARQNWHSHSQSYRCDTAVHSVAEDTTITLPTGRTSCRRPSQSLLGIFLWKLPPLYRSPPGHLNLTLGVFFAPPSARNSASPKPHPSKPHPCNMPPAKTDVALQFSESCTATLKTLNSLIKEIKAGLLN